MLRSSLIIITLLIAIFTSYYLERPHIVKPASSVDFSVERVIDMLTSFGDDPHPTGSAAAEKVRDLLVDELIEIGLDVRIESGYIYQEWNPTFRKMVYVENIVAVLPGDGSSDKKVVLAGHYDSVEEGPGAADDGYSVASMVETARLLTEQPRKNDLILLITDCEEYGLLGAEYHMKNNDSKDYAVLLNYEARGNEGPGIAFEWSDNNSWLVKQMAKAYKLPIANSLSYEIYELMPNASDFTEFKPYDIPGINHAFIDGFSYYHHPQDDVAHISKESVQHTGENMYLAARHFVNTDIDVKHEGNATFFNFYGSFMYYQAKYDLFLLIFTLLLTLGTIGLLLRRNKSRVSQFLMSFLMVVVSTVLVLGLLYGLSVLIKMLYPHYSTFYAYQYYNHEWYLLTGLGFTVAGTSILSPYIIKKWGLQNFRISILLLLGMLSIGLYLSLTTGAYIFMFPLIFTNVAFILPHEKKDTVLITIMKSALLICIIGFWVFLSHNLYLAFSITALAGAVIPCLFFMFIYYGLFNHNSGSRQIFIISGLLLFVVTLIIAHVKSIPTPEKPLLVDLGLYHQPYNNKSYLGTYSDRLFDLYPQGFKPMKDSDKDDYRARVSYKKDVDIDFSSLLSTIDTSFNNNYMEYKVINPIRTQTTRLSVDDVSNLDSIFVNGVLNRSFEVGDSGRYYSTMYGVGLDSAVVRVVKRDVNQPFVVQLQNVYHGFIEDIPLSDDAIYRHPSTRIFMNLNY
jgi:hypothetical protein